MSETTVVLSVPGMSCGHCVAAVSGELEQVPGVETVTVDLDAKTATVTGPALEMPALVAAVDRAGYDVVT